MTRGVAVPRNARIQLSVNKKHLINGTSPDIWINEDKYPEYAIHLNSDSHNAYGWCITIDWDCFYSYDLSTYYQNSIIKSINK